MEQQEIILKAKNLVFSYDGEKKPALNGLSLEIKKGKRTALMGANGSGKSTFFLCCNGILKPKKGSLYWEGESYSYDKKFLLDLRSKVGIVFQDPDNQLFSASVQQEISFGPFNMGIEIEKIKEDVKLVMDDLGITPFSQKPTHALSGGQKKIVSIADILVMHPKLMILDEPQTALDPKHEDLVHEIVNRLSSQGITVLIATHDVDFAYEWADDVILLKDGQAILQGSPEEVFSNKQVLQETNLKVPNVLHIYQSLRESNKIAQTDFTPRNWNELEKLLHTQNC